MLACWYVGMFSHGSRTIAHEENCPNSKTNPKPNQQAILLGAIVWIPFLMILARI